MFTEPNSLLFNSAPPNGFGGRALRVNNVARRLDVPDRTVRWWAQTGQLRGWKEGQKIWKFAEADVERFRLKLAGEGFDAL